MKLTPGRRATLLIAFVLLAIYGVSIGYEFVYDDHVQIERNPWLRAPEGFRMFLTRPFWDFYRDRGTGPSNYYRPFFGIIYSLTARAFGLEPGAFHFISVALHLAVALLVMLGAWKLARSEIAALAAGLLFVVYPPHAEAVSWVGGQADLLAALFGLLALFLYLETRDRDLRDSRDSRDARGWLGAFFYLLACLSKEPGAALILVLGVLEISEWRWEGSFGAAVRRGLGRLLPYIAVAGLYVALRIHALGGFSPRSYGVTASPKAALAYAAGLLTRYLGFLFVPYPARVLASVPAPTLLSPVAIAGFGIALAAIAGLAVAAWRGRGRREIVLPIALILAFLLPVLAVNSIGGSNFSERYLYIPSIGLAWLFGLLCARAAARLPEKARKPAAIGVLALLAASGVAAWARSGIYKSDLTLFRAAVRTNPRSEIARNNLGMALYNRGRIDEAEREYHEALRLIPGSVPPLANLGVLYEKKGDLPKARKTFEEALRLSPTHAISAVHLARMDREKGDRAAAIRRLDALFAAGGENYEALVERADLWLEDGHPEKAIPLLERAVSTFPDYTKGKDLLARAQREKSRS